MMRTLLCLIGILSLPPIPGRAQTDLDSILDANPHVWWGVLVTEIPSGDTLFARNAERNFMPASVTKLFTTAAVLDQLGPNYTYVTRLYADGLQTGDVLHGNLIVRGAGDPSTGAPGPNWQNLFLSFADSLHALGIREVHGDIIGDDNVFDDIALGVDWSWEDLTYGYAAQISGLTFYDATVKLRILPTRPGQPGKISIIPEPKNYLTIVNESRTLPRGQNITEAYWRIPESNQIIVSSQVPSGRTESEDVTVHNPTLYFVHHFSGVLESEDVRVHGQLLDVDDLISAPDYASAQRIAEHRSAPVSELITTVNKSSHNLYAEHLLKTLGHVLPVPDLELAPGSAAMGGLAAMRTYVNAGIDTTRMQLVDGSGLSRKNLISPAGTIDLLRYMADHPNILVQKAFLSSLPISGKDGTLEYRFARNTAANGRVLAKTGTLGSVNTLAGYILEGGTPRIAFVIFANHFRGSHAPIRAIQESFISTLINNLDVGNE